MQFACCRLNCIEPDSFCCIFSFCLVLVVNTFLYWISPSHARFVLLLHCLCCCWLRMESVSGNCSHYFSLSVYWRCWDGSPIFFFFLLLSLYLFSFFWLRAAPLFNFLLLFFRIHCIRLSWMQFFSLDDITERKRMATDAIIATVVS